MVKTQEKTRRITVFGGKDRVRTVVRMVDRMVKGDPQTTCSYGSQTPHIPHHYTLPIRSSADPITLTSLVFWDAIIVDPLAPIWS